MLLGQTLGPFLIDKELGSGAMGTVYRGKHKATGQKVAIKLIAPGLTSNPTVLARFQRETAILKQLEHPNLVKILASGKFHATPFYVMEYLEGESLDHVIARRNRITWEELVELGKQLCAGLKHAHEKGIVHRDLKPSNLMVLKDGTVKLTDFGIAKDTDVTALTATNSTVGTASYMSPEQCRGERNITHKSDLYSMGVMFYELITGRKPFQAETVMEMFLQHTRGKFERPSRLVLDLPVWLDNLICQLLEKEPDKRPFDAAMVAESLGLVRQKHEQQQSAGVEAAKKRKIDRTDFDPPLAEEDRDTARALLGKKKKKPAKEAFYRQGWFTFLTVGALLAAAGFLIYAVFLKPPGADRLFALAEDGMLSSELSSRIQTRENAIAQFLQYHPDDPRVQQIRRWKDQVDRDECEQQMMNRRDRFQPAHLTEKNARLALSSEEDGRFDEAVGFWKLVLAKKESNDPELRPWGLVAEKHLADLKGVGDQYKDLQAKVLSEIAGSKKAEARHPEEKLALAAVRAEHAKKFAEARLYWGDLQKQAKERDDRLWILLASKRLRETVLERTD